MFTVHWNVPLSKNWNLVYRNRKISQFLKRAKVKNNKRNNVNPKMYYGIKSLIPFNSNFSLIKLNNLYLENAIYGKRNDHRCLLNNHSFSQESRWHIYWIWVWHEVGRNCELVRWQNVESKRSWQAAITGLMTSFPQMKFVSQNAKFFIEIDGRGDMLCGCVCMCLFICLYMCEYI